jgi:uncharacterized RDD family membrane protein YckC
MLYESMLLFGVLFVAALLFSTLLQQKNALHLRHYLQEWLFLVVAVYFVGFWSHGGQTLAMKTWHLKLVSHNGGKVGLARGFARFLLAWLWIIPGLALAWGFGGYHWMLALFPVANILLWALTIYLDPDRQFLHDRLAGTRIASTLPAQHQVPHPASSSGA